MRVLSRCGHCRQTGCVRESAAQMRVRSPVACPVCRGRGIVFDTVRGPCEHPPGSAEKVAILRARYRYGLDLFRPDDVTGYGSLS